MSVISRLLLILLLISAVVRLSAREDDDRYIVSRCLQSLADKEKAG